MDNLDVCQAVSRLRQYFPSFTEHFDVFISKPEWTTNDRQALLDKLSILLLNEACTLKVAEFFGPFLLDLLIRCQCLAANNKYRYEAVCVALGKLVWLFPDVVRFTYDFFSQFQSIFGRFDDDKEEKDPPCKKAKVSAEEEVSDTALLIAALQLLAFDVQFFKNIWNWSSIIPFLQSADEKAWLTYQCLAKTSNISNGELNSILQERFSESKIIAFHVKYGDLLKHIWVYNPLVQSRIKEIKDVPDSKRIVSSDLSEDVVYVEGVVLDKFPMELDAEPNKELMVITESTRSVLQELAMAVASENAVLLQGPVGCGKTSLVKHLARLTGRHAPECLLSIQLGDQIDSKLLLGSYCCTETLGEFVWVPGILTQAVSEGQWLLLEDIDCAPMDVITLLVSIIESRSFVLPGHANPVQVQPGFQLFATQRLLPGHGTLYLEHKNHCDLLNKLWRKITIQNLSCSELKEVIVAKWPNLQPFVDRILEVYYLLTEGKFVENIVCEGEAEERTIKPPSSLHRGRLVSSRDLFKFCKRISKGFSNYQTEEAVKVMFQHALECFCDSLPSPKDRVQAAECIGIKFNMPLAKAAYLCQKHQPSVCQYSNRVEIGRVTLPVVENSDISFLRPSQMLFAYTKQAVSLLEKVAVAVMEQEPVLLVGETGTGKTAIIQYLAKITGNSLAVINMNQQSDSTDLMGGYKPVDMKIIIQPILEEFRKLFPITFSANQNVKFMGHVARCFRTKKWDNLLTLMINVQKVAQKNLVSKNYQPKLDAQYTKNWKKLGTRIQQMKIQLSHSKSALAFAFIEGALIKAMKLGTWILLDEINLAEAETLQCLASVLENDSDSLLILEKGDKLNFKRHPNFRLFACMNPATDVGKKDLPVGIRNRFTEFFMEELYDKNDLMTLVRTYMSNGHVLESVVDFYLHVRQELVDKLNDGTGHHPHYSLRTLCRALKYFAADPCGNELQSLYEGLCLSFLSQLDRVSHPIVTEAIMKCVFKKKKHPIQKQKIPRPSSGKYINIQGHWIPCGNRECQIPENYIITSSIRRNLRDLARIVSVGKYPVLLQGETSVGKTSLVQYLANVTGNYCVRINNHEHTDIQEYVGTYVADDKGKLVFQEGVLVTAMRKGHWIILDELNLAPTEVMEALNRVLDDNRELFITETQETVNAHPKFMVFATQNPPGLYGGRKVLSRAFRNRFIELHFSEIPAVELETILKERCAMPLSYCKKIVAVMQELQLRRRESRIFAGKHGYITLRDLFRWGERYRQCEKPEEGFYDWDQLLADEGYMLLAGRVRRDEEAALIQEVIEKHVKRKINPLSLFAIPSSVLKKELKNSEFRHCVWTPKMMRLYVLIQKALKFDEPVLLVGNTGCGKTTICQIFAHLAEAELYSVNCHMHTESADFLGGLRPVRSSKPDDDRLFEWVFGPLIDAMRDSDFFLADEISLADDSVLERLNSVLEPERCINLTDNNYDADGEKIVCAAKGFQFLATMNPGGDYGKKELSPALRNRFTEIWCPSDLSIEELMTIVEHNLKRGIMLSPSDENSSGFGMAIVCFLTFFLDTEIGRRITVSIRDILTWVNFINATVFDDNVKDSSEQGLTPEEAYVHGACLVFIDSLGSSLTAVSTSERIQEIKRMSYEILVDAAERISGKDLEDLRKDVETQWKDVRFSNTSLLGMTYFGLGPFLIEAIPSQNVEMKYTLSTSAVKSNTLRILRAMQLSKPILLEGSPGVGKTSLICALAKVTGHNVVRINLSEQTDISDLIGMDLPVDNGECGQFGWRDGPLLQAIKKGDWILLDELNLASQSVLEGLNSCLDHRGEIFITELRKSFKVCKNSRIFACQNPHKQGGSRKGLPRSFLNRFIQVYMEPLTSQDLADIAVIMYSDVIPTEMISGMIQFNERLASEINEQHLWGNLGHQFNLRDVIRWCELLISSKQSDTMNPVNYIGLIYADRMRTDADKKKVMELCEEMFGEMRTKCLQLKVHSNCIQVGYSFLPRIGGSSLKDHSPLFLRLSPLNSLLPCLESLMKCIEMNWMPILVGPPASGKSGLVHFLASLTGQPLKVFPMNPDMDTTELLGGFEQADLSRLVDYALQDLEPILNDAILQCLKRSCSGSFPDLVMILKEVHRLKQNNPSKNFQSVFDESRACKRRIECLKGIFILLSEFKFDSELAREFNALKHKVADICDKLLTTGVVSSGGKFEWVDSVLVQAVEKGHWLLVENVNFCSPSVLDRLNCLLETDGKLLVTEQGVVNGKMKQIEPHPNFRIIMTMDPRNGEISPAMRNRGIEIALHRDLLTFEGSVDVWDLLRFFHTLNITNSQMMTLILTFHATLSSNGIAMTPTAYDLINCINLSRQYLQKNKSMFEAVTAGFKMGFVKNIVDQQARSKALDLLDAIPRKDYKLPLDVVPYSRHLGHMTFTAADFQINSIFVNAKREGILFECLFKYYMDELCGKNTSSLPLRISPPLLSCPPPPDVARWLDIFCLSLKIIFENCSPLQWKVYSKWMENVLHACSREFRHFPEHPLIENISNLLLNLKKTHFDAFYDISFVKEYLDFLKNLVAKSSKFDPSEIPLDLRYNEHLLEKLAYEYDGNDDESVANVHPQDVISNISSSANKFLLRLNLDTLFHLKRSILAMNGSRNRSLWALSESVQNDPNSTVHVILKSLSPFLSSFQAALQDIIEFYPCPVPDEEFWKMQEFLYILYEFLYFCMEPYTEQTLEYFTIHWNYLLKGFSKLLKSTDESVKLQDLIQIINESLNPEVSMISQIRRKLIKVLGVPTLFCIETAAKMFESIITVQETINIHQIINSPQRFKDLQVVLTHGVEWNKTLIKAVYRCLHKSNCTNDFIEMDSHVRTIKLQLHDAGLLSTNTEDDDEIMEICQKPAIASKIEPGKLESKIQLLPLYDYFFVLSEAKLLDVTMGKLRQQFESLVKLTHFSSEASHFSAYFCEEEISQLTLDPVHTGLLYRLCHKHYAKETYISCLVYFFRHLRSSPSSSDMISYLNWKENVTNRKQLRKLKLDWSKQSPLLSYICFNLLSGNQPDSSVLTLNNFAEKSKQAEVASRLLWCNFAVVKQGRMLFKNRIVAIISMWHEFLVIGLSMLSKYPFTPTVENILLICQNLGLKSELMLNGSENVLVESFKCLDKLKNLVHLDEKKVVENTETIGCQEFPNVMTEVNWLSGKSLCLVGLTTVLLLSPLDAIDPIEKRKVRLLTLESLVIHCIMEKEFRNWQYCAVTGSKFENVGNNCHPYLERFAEVVSIFQNQREVLSGKIAYRRNCSEFNELRNDVQSFLTSIGKPQLMYNELENLEKLKNQMNESGVNIHELSSALERLENMTENFKIFMTRISTKYVVYRDLILPFLLGIEMLVMGFQSISSFLCSVEIQKEISLSSNTENLVGYIGSFPYLHKGNIITKPVDLASFLAEESTTNAVKLLGGSSYQTTFPLLKSALLEIINETAIYGKNSTTHVLITADAIFTHFHEVWKEQQQNLQIKKEEEESFYEYKTKTYGEEPEDEKELQKRVRTMFPSYREHFSEFITNEVIEDSNVEAIPETMCEATLTSDDILDIWSNHATLISTLSSSFKKDISANNFLIKNTSIPDFITSYNLRYGVIRAIILNNPEKIDSAVDIDLIGGHLLASAGIYRHFDGTKFNNEDKDMNANYDIYHDPSPEEVLGLAGSLESLVKKINLVLQEHPENALLLQILTIIDRIKGLSINDPLMKYVTGLELVLSAAQLWEQNAHKGVSLKAQLEILVQKLIHFRKMELSCWNQCLENVMKKQFVNCSKFWFHLYSITLDTSESEDSIVSSLRQFMEESSLGEFEARLVLLQTFLHHLKLESANKMLKKKRDVLFNICSYYAQYLPAIKNKILAIREPIEKIVKDFVKISHWNETTLHSPQKSGEKAQHIFKNIKAFEKELNQSAKLEFQISSNQGENTGTPWILNADVKEFLATVPQGIDAQEDIPASEATVFDKAHYYNRKARKICRRIFNLFPVFVDINILNNFSGDIVETVQELESLEFKKKRDKENQKREIRRVLDHKRKAIAKLFKELTLIGLSHRKGLICSKKHATKQESFYLVPLLEDELSIQDETSGASSSTLSYAWRDSNSFYYKCIAQFFLLEKSAQSPSKDIGNVTIIENCMGFGWHLLDIVISQRHILGDSTQRIKSLSEKANTLLKLSGKIGSENMQHQLNLSEPPEFFFPPQIFVLVWKGKLYGLLVQTAVALQQISILLNCCSSNNSDFYAQKRAPKYLLRDSPAWLERNAMVDEWIEKVQGIISMLKPTTEKQNLIETWEPLAIICKCFKHLMALVVNFTALEKENDDAMCFSFLLDLKDNIYEQWNEFSLETPKLCFSDKKTSAELGLEEKAVVHSAKRLFEKMLKVIENVFNFFKDSPSQQTVSNKSRDEELKHLFDERITTTVTEMKQLLKLQEISKLTNKVIKSVRSLKDLPAQSLVLEKYVIVIAPVLNQYTQMAKLYLTAMVGSHRTSCKLLSNLLDIFNSLIVKGFSIPPELQDLAEKSGATKFKDIELGGLGEGEGVKDVSETLTSEDQLEDASVKGAEKKEEPEKSDLKDEKEGIEMSEDFQGELYDPEMDQKSEGDDDEESLDDADLEKKMGNVEQNDADKLDEKIWNDNEDDSATELDEDECGKGVSLNETSELAPKDDHAEEGEGKGKGDIPEKCPDQDQEVYEGDRPDPMIDAPVSEEPEIIDLSDDMEITDDVDDSKPEQETEIEMEIDTMKDEEGADIDETKNEETETKKDESSNLDTENPSEIDLGSDEEKEGPSCDVADVEMEVEPAAEEKKDDTIAATQVTASKATEQVLPADKVEKHSSKDMATPDDNVADLESGVQEASDQHHEGQSEAKDSRSMEAGHEGKKSKQVKPADDKDEDNNAEQEKLQQEIKQPNQQRSLGNPELSRTEKLKISDKQKSAEDAEQVADKASEYEHVTEEKDTDVQAMDTATKEQASKQPRLEPQDSDDIYYVIDEGQSSDEDRDWQSQDRAKNQDGSANRQKIIHDRGSGEVITSDEEMEEEEKDDSEDKFIETLGAQRGPESSIHTQHDLWSALALPHIENLRNSIVDKLDSLSQDRSTNTDMCQRLWQELELIISPLVQELCEQLRLVLEPTKMSKLKGDYRSGKRLNMRKIIPFIASQFRKDKIWLRRTKPSKREYQIMLAVDDSSSMADNHSKELAFESLILLGKSLSLLEAGELAVVSFGEKVRLLHDFGEPFNPMSGAKIVQSFSFAQTKTRIAQLIHHATAQMVQMRKHQSNLISKEVSQLLIIISDGRGIFNEGKDEVMQAIQLARDNNVFMVFVIIDNPENQQSILDIQSPVFQPDGEVEMKSYMEDFPFPFYILLRDVVSLPLVLGEALRQWFELVTSTER